MIFVNIVLKLTLENIEMVQNFETISDSFNT